ncbi:MAG: GFA family protein, partial [Caulobacteraceae bacterium]
RYFCRGCGSPVLSCDETGDEVEIFLGALDQPNRLAPTYEAFIPRRETWLGGTPGLMRHYEGNRTGPRRGEP